MNEPARRTRHRSAIRDDSAQRRADVTLILAVVNATRTWEEQAGRTAPVKPLRELLWTVWEQPRLPRPVYRGKYPLSVPWTPAARAAYGDPTARLSIEHVTPAAVLVRRLLAAPPSTNAAFVRVLNTITYVVVAAEDNQRLVAAGVGAKLAPGSADPLDRYRVAGLDPATFLPIEEAPPAPPARSDRP